MYIYLDMSSHRHMVVYNYCLYGLCYGTHTYLYTVSMTEPIKQQRPLLSCFVSVTDKESKKGEHSTRAIHSRPRRYNSEPAEGSGNGYHRISAGRPRQIVDKQFKYLTQ